MIYAVITTAPRRPNKATTLAAANQQRQRTNGGSEGVGFHDNDSLNRFGSGCSSIGYLDEEGYWLFLSDSCPCSMILQALKMRGLKLKKVLLKLKEVLLKLRLLGC
ncbi:hypothetical protein ACFE04_014499 [Oxalis oulophora]